MNISIITILLLLVCTVMLPQLTKASDDCGTNYGLLDIPLMLQEESAWCWAATANVFTNRFQYKNSIGQSYKQCELYNLAKGTSCCGLEHPIDLDSDPECLYGGAPWQAFEKLNPIIDSNGFAPARSWDQIKDQICPAGHPRHPFIFVDKITSDGVEVSHTNVIKGFDTVNGTRILYVDTHYALGSGEVGPKHIEYDCGYVDPLSCGKGYDREADYVDIRSLVDTTPPSSPRNLRVR